MFRLDKILIIKWQIYYPKWKSRTKSKGAKCAKKVSKTIKVPLVSDVRGAHQCLSVLLWCKIKICYQSPWYGSIVSTKQNFKSTELFYCLLQCQAQLEQNAVFCFYFPIKTDNPNCYNKHFPNPVNNPNPSQPKISELIERINLSLKKFVFGGGLFDYSVTPGPGLFKSQMSGT